ncbi:MAG: hypothetical protein A2086_09000 [Spirochaetes bacterium GWD1_27_9]|nr:MAG: hypothetical protein A2Z98_05615 [Spirochaetes bacterium GWB1_27_13]OHD20671.1 MAG: hypothetical protein A2Y34_17430 [Spirochaetes bacterium GWC1_27_15]OHD44676.1 MAG: hypothetical protein A2086_09000 [Spirochaetes bacterium GWD1_27_9]
MADIYIKPTSDIFFKYLFGREETKDLLISFINAVFEEKKLFKIQTVEIKNPFNIKKFILEKESILDIKGEDEKKRKYDIEVQSTGNEYFKNRSLYYWSKLYSSQILEGEDYKILQPAICIDVLEFDLFDKLEDYHNSFMIIEKDNREFALTDHLIINFIELKKFNKKKIVTKLDKWLYFFKHCGKEDFMEVLIKDDIDIMKSKDEYNKFCQNEELKEAYESRMKWLSDYKTNMSCAKEEGFEDGFEKGVDEEKRIISKQMKKDGMSIESIFKYTGLPKEEIEKL